MTKMRKTITVVFPIFFYIDELLKCICYIINRSTMHKPSNFGFDLI